MKERTILHCDLNSFFASVELLSHPDLRNRPAAVCGSREKRHGIVLAKNEKAKQAGVKTAEAIWQAQQKCPDLVILEPHYDKYSYYSKEVKKILLSYTDKVEAFGLDESWLDVSDCFRLFGSGEKIAYKIKERIKNETGLTVSVGVSFNKVFAKLGSDYKKPDAVTVISKENFKSKIYSLPANAMLGIGKSTYSKLLKLGIITIGDLATADISALRTAFGINGERLWYFANGLDMSPVIPEAEIPDFKSISRSVTGEADLENNAEVWRVFLALSEKIAKCMHDEACSAMKITVMARRTTLKWESYCCKTDIPVRLSNDIAKIAMQIFVSNYDWKHPLRSIGVAVSDFIETETPFQTSLYMRVEEQSKKEIIESEVFNLRERYGNNIIVKASLMDFTQDLDIKTLPGHLSHS